jgi:exodeoxyribonuclease X
MPQIRVYDTETQGFEAEDKVCEIAWTDLINDGDGWRIGVTGGRLCRVETMPPQARAVHHIAAADTGRFLPFDPGVMWAEAKADGIDVVASHNWAFDVLRFGEPQLPAICTLKAARRLWPEAPGHSNGVLRYWLEDAGEIACDPAKAQPAHRAGPDTYVTANVLRHMLSLTSAAQMVRWTAEPLVFHRWAFGKHKGQTLAETPADYLRWVIDRSDLDTDTKWNCSRELDRRRAEAA